LARLVSIADPPRPDHQNIDSRNLWLTSPSSSGHGTGDKQKSFDRINDIARRMVVNIGPGADTYSDLAHEQTCSRITSCLPARGSVAPAWRAGRGGG
jgi:hypothetical protein